MKLVIAKSAQKALGSVQPKLAAALVKELSAIAADPFGRHPNAARLKGGENEYRLRHGDWRAVYHLDRACGVMTVTIIKARGGAYT